MTSNHIKAVANDIGEETAATVKSAASSGHDALSKASTTVRDFATQASDKADDLYKQARDHVHDATHKLPDSASDAIAAGQRVYRDSSKTVGRRVAKQPIEALLLAGAIGYLIGWASNRS